MPVLPLVIFAGVLSVDIPTRQIETSWRALATADHYQGSWSITVDGTTRTGDWIVVAKQDFLPAIYGASYLGSRAMFFVSSTSKRVCAVDAVSPRRLYCSDGTSSSNETPNVDVNDYFKLEVPRSTARLDRTECTTGSCWGKQIGSVTVDVAAVEPTLEEEELLFERTTGRTLATWLRASTVRTKRGLELRWTFDEETVLPATMLAGARTDPFGPQRYAREIVRREAVLRIGPRPAQTAISAREVERYIEDCVSRGGGSCMPHLPTCQRRN